jgi:TM2 domain-containing membrane protein YozV
MAMRTKTAAILWCFFLGAFGAHKFYLGQTGWGVMYLLFCWTGIPSFAAFIELIMLLVMPETDFNRRFNGVITEATSSVRDSTAALGDLKRLYDDGIITAEEYEEKRKKLLKNI